MGISVHLALFPERVPESTWEEIYEKARRVANQWTPRPLSLAWRQVGTVRVAAYVLDIETPQGLHIVGDAETLTTGESFTFPVKLSPAASGKKDDESPATDTEDDVLVAIGRWVASDYPQPAWSDLLGPKTQGFPYHSLIVALGLLVENVLPPGTAVVHGDLSSSDGEQARRGLAAILGEEFEPPVAMDAKRLRRRLAVSLRGDALDQALRMLGPSVMFSEARDEELLKLLRSSSSGRFHYELEQVVRTCADPSGLSTQTQLLLRELVDTTRSIMMRGKLRKRFKQWGAARTREELAHRTLKISMGLTSRAWDAIEIADLDELAFLYAATCTDTMRWEVHHAVRALFENRVLRCI